MDYSVFDGALVLYIEIHVVDGVVDLVVLDGHQATHRHGAAILKIHCRAIAWMGCVGNDIVVDVDTVQEDEIAAFTNKHGGAWSVILVVVAVSDLGVVHKGDCASLADC